MVVVLGLTGLGLAGCAGSSGTLPSGFTSAQSGDLGNDYRLIVGDKLKLVVYGEDQLSGDIEVGGNGHVALPLVGEVEARGLTIAELTVRIRDRLSQGYLKNPKVTLQAAKLRPIYVHGEVRNPGEFTFRNGMTFPDAVAMAGGYSYRAVTDTVYLRRDGDAVEREVPVAAAGLVLPGDNIRIPERIF
ncbi:MAG: polysaccharide biosynthesis/export family protein [Hyphomicrobiaceae bacterium]